jgi:hypothetical protein
MTGPRPRLLGYLPLLEKFRFSGVPPSPPTLKALPGAAFAKMPLQNLEPQGFKSQNLDNKRLTVVLATTARMFEPGNDQLFL